MEDVLEVYQRPYDPEYPVVCMDEANRQLIEEVRPSLPVQPGACKKVDYEHRRKGVVDFFMMFEPLTGQRQVEVRDSRTRKDFAYCIKKPADEYYPDCGKIVLVMDNLNTHSIASLYDTFPPEEALRLANRLEIGIASWNAPPEKVLIYAGFRGFENEKIFEFSPSVLPIFQSGLGEDTTWRVVRVVEGATLEKSCAARHLGFESLTLRQPEKPVLPASLFYSRFPIPKPASIASAEITFELYSRCA